MRMIFTPNLLLDVSEPDPANISFYEQHLPPVTHYLGSANYSLTTSATSSVYLAHYPMNEQPFSGPVEKLTFTQLGNSVPPYLGDYAKTCKTVDFTGYINAPSTIMHVLDQLPRVADVNIFLGATKQQLWMHEQGVKGFTATPVRPSVKCLNIAMDMDYFREFQCACNGDLSQCSIAEKCPTKFQNHLLQYVKTLLECAQNSFPNLERVVVFLPENAVLLNAVYSLAVACLNEPTELIIERSSLEIFYKLFSLNYAGYLRTIPDWYIPNINAETRTVSWPSPPSNIQLGR